MVFFQSCSDDEIGSKCLIVSSLNMSQKNCSGHFSGALQTNKNAHILALTDEGGYIGLYNTRKKFTDSSHYGENAG